MRRPLALAIHLLALSVLAAGAGARVPEQGMEEPVRYTLGLLERGATWTPARTPRTDSIQAGHMANIGRMARLGALVAAGPFESDGRLAGVFLFAPGVSGFDTLLAGDSAIATHRLECRLYPFVAPPGLGRDYRRRAEASGTFGQGRPDSMVTFDWVMLERGPRYDASPTPAVTRLIERHRDHVERLRARGLLVYAGAIEGTGELRGVLVMRGDSAAVARAVAADPAVRAGRFRPRILRWWTAWGTIPGH